MTTVAYRNGALAGDTAISNAYSILPNAIHKVWAHHGSLASAAGSASFHGNFGRWFQSGEVGAPPLATKNADRYDVGMIVRPGGNIFLHEEEGWFEIHPEYYAIGSGREHAYGAFFMGATAEQAVAAAIKHDPDTAGDVDVVRFEE